MAPKTRGESQRLAERRLHSAIDQLPHPALEVVGLTRSQVHWYAKGDFKLEDYEVIPRLEEVLGDLAKMQAKFRDVIEGLRAQKPVPESTEDADDGAVLAKRKSDQMSDDQAATPAVDNQETIERPYKKLKGKEPVPAAQPTCTLQALAAEALSYAAAPAAGLSIPYPQEMEIDSQKSAQLSGPVAAGAGDNLGSVTSTLTSVPAHEPRLPLVTAPPMASLTPDQPKSRMPLPTSRTPLPMSRPKSSGSHGSSSRLTSSPPTAQRKAHTGQTAATQVTPATASAPGPVPAPVPTLAALPASAAGTSSAPGSVPIQAPAPVPATAPVQAPASVQAAASVQATAPVPAAAPVPMPTFIYKTGPLPPHILNAPIPAPPPIPTGTNIPAKTLAAYNKCHSIHFSGAGGFRRPIPCYPCQKSGDKINSCIVNLDVGGGLVCNHCANKKEKCSYQLNEEARIILETGVAVGPNKCQRCTNEERAQHAASNLTYRAECYQAPVGMRDQRQLGSACARCIIVGKKESCTLNENPRKKDNKPRDMIAD